MEKNIEEESLLQLVELLGDVIIPPEKRDDFKVLCKYGTEMQHRIKNLKAIPVGFVGKYNWLCNKLFPSGQDASEVYEKEKPEELKAATEPPEGNKIGYDKREQVYARAFAEWGVDEPLIIAINEMSDLTKELCKFFHGRMDRREIAEKTADVTIAMERLRRVLSINDDVCYCMDWKILRLAERLGMDARALTSEGGTDGDK